MGVSTVEANGTGAGALPQAQGRPSPALDSQWLRELRHAPESILHPRRRRAAELRLQNFNPTSVLFLCHGNICRSPFAAAVFQRSCSASTLAGVVVRSAGFIGAGRTPPTKALAAASRCGIDMSVHRSRVVTREALRAADLIVVMDSDQARSVRSFLRSGNTRVLVLGDLDPNPVTRRTIADPWGGSDFAFESSYNRIERCVRELVRVIGDAA